MALTIGSIMLGVGLKNKKPREASVKTCLGKTTISNKYNERLIQMVDA